MKRRLVFLLCPLILATHITVQGQFNFKEGRLISLQNDTIMGFISDRGTIRNSKVCRFKDNRKARVTRYFPGDIKSYQFIGDKYYASKSLYVNNEFRKCFVEVLLEGKVDLYHYYQGKEMRYFIEKDSGEFIGLVNEKYTFGKPRSSNLTVYWHEYEIEHSIYKDTLLKLFSDCPAVAYQIFDVEYDMRSLTNVTKEYINQTCTGEKCITYERDLRKMKDRVGFYSGVQPSKIYYSGSAMQSSPDVAFPFGLLYNIPLSQLSQKLSFQAELSGRYLNYSSDYVNLPDNFEDLEISTWLLGIPMLLRYAITQRKFSPYFGLGKEWCLTLNPEVEYTSISGYSDGLPEYSQNLNYLYRFQKGGWFFDAGINYEINPYYSLFVNLRFQRTINKIIGEKHQNNFTYKNAEGVEYSSDLVSLQLGFMFR